ncbi:MAG: RluA family pseudouridine synthase [Planctomycetota bacterium]
MAIVDHLEEEDPLPGEVRSFSAGPEAAGERLDGWLARQLPELSRSSLKRLIQEGHVLVAGASVKPSHTLHEGEAIVVELPPAPSPMPLPEEIPLDILHEDASIIVINKPSDRVVHPPVTGAEQGTIVNALLGYTDELSREAGHFRPGIVHRLDRETSGLLIVARSDAAHRYIADQFRERLVKKEYLALAHGIPEEEEGEIDLPLGRSLVNRKKMAVRHDEGGKSACTHWRVSGFVGPFTWFRLLPVSGRTHQIRVHLKAIGHPIVCDAVYGRERTITRRQLLGRSPAQGEPPVLSRQALHARRIRFRHPEDDRRVDFEAPLPADLAPLWEMADRPPEGGTTA